MKILKLLSLLLFLLVACQPMTGIISTGTTETPTPLLRSTAAPTGTKVASPTYSSTAMPPTQTIEPTSAIVTTIYHDPIYHLTFKYPKSWKQVGALTFQGKDGFLKIAKLKNYHSKSFSHVCIDYRLTNVDQNDIYMYQIPLGSGCIFGPTNPGPEDTMTWIFRYQITPRDADFLVLETNYLYSRLITDSLKIEISLKVSGVQPTPAPVQKTLSPGIELQEFYAGDVVPNAMGYLGGIVASERDVWYKNNPPAQNCGPAITIGGAKFSVDELYSPVNIKKDNQTIFTMPIIGLRGVESLCEWNGQWVLEANGFVVINGVNINHKLGVEDIFDWRLIAEKPFYFYAQNGKVHISYDGKTLPIEYDYVYHYGCCEIGSSESPHANDGMAWFYGIRDNIWYYVEIKLTH